MALLTTLTSANEVLLDSVKNAPEHSTIGGVNKVRFRTTRSLEYRGLTEAAAGGFADDPTADLAGTILSDGASVAATIHVDGFTNATGTVFPGTSVAVDGDDHVYHTASAATIASNECDLILDENIIEAGSIAVKGGSQTGTSLLIDGFTETTGYVRKGTRLEIAGDATDYTVTAEVAVSGSEATVVISPTLQATPSDDDAVTLTHPIDNAPITLTQTSVSLLAIRAGGGPIYRLRVSVDYYTSDWEDDA